MRLDVTSGEDSGDDGSHQEANEVRITRSFTLDYSVCAELKKQKNQSRFVESAVRAKLMAMDLLKKNNAYYCEPCDKVYTPKNPNFIPEKMFCKYCKAKLSVEHVR